MKPKVKWRLVTGFVVLAVAGVVLLFPRLSAAWLSHRLEGAKTLPEAAKVVRKLLAHDTDSSRDVVTEYAAKSPSRAFDRERSIFLMQDESSGEIYEVVHAPQGSVAMTTGAGLSKADRESLEKAVQEATPTASYSVVSIGKPPIIFDGIHLLEKQDGPDRVRFILREKGKDRYYEIRFTFEKGRLISEGLHDVSEEDVQSLSAGSRWPKEWD